MKLLLLTLCAVSACSDATPITTADASLSCDTPDAKVGGDAAVVTVVPPGRDTFRYDTFGDEAFWGDALGIHKAIEGSANGGVGPGVSPKTALSVGLKVDSEALPADVVAAITAGQVNLDDPASTLALLKLNAVVGVKGTFN